MGDSNPLATFGYVAKAMAERKIAFICARESMDHPRIGPELKKIFGGVYIANQGQTKQTAEQVIRSGEADAVAFGKLFIANPDLPARFEKDAPLNTPNPETFYAQGEQGYVDYPALS
jgi:2,4-dienoyl-CoA reductase-like NADH-dependent reductase (Old Yellow Enzyme family)